MCFFLSKYNGQYRLMTSVREWNWQSEDPVNVIIVVKTFFGGEIAVFLWFSREYLFRSNRRAFPISMQIALKPIFGFHSAPSNRVIAGANIKQNISTTNKQQYVFEHITKKNFHASICSTNIAFF